MLIHEARGIVDLIMYNEVEILVQQVLVDHCNLRRQGKYRYLF